MSSSEGRDARRHRQHVVVGCTAMREGIGAGRIEAVHDIGAAAKCADRRAAADIFPYKLVRSGVMPYLP